MESTKLFDSFGRQHNYLRISLTDACNLRCVYCMPNEKVIVTPQSKLMSSDEIFELAQVFVKMGVNKIRLTGGEPLVRKDAHKIILQLAKLPVELAVSTNGVLIDEYIETFRQANITSVNVSLDTLNSDEFTTITKRGDFDKIINNIYLLLQHQFFVKVNMVVMKGINDHCILDFIEWTKEHSLQVRFIEVMPFSGNLWKKENVFSYKEMLAIINKKYATIKLKDKVNDTSKKYKVENYIGNFGFISTISEPFCDSCNRLRITADGKFKNCLFSKTEIDLLSPLRNNEKIESLILENLFQKKKERGGQFNDLSNANKIENRSMIKIGG